MNPLAQTRTAKAPRSGADAPDLRGEKFIHGIIDRVLHLAKSRRIPETEVEVDEVVDALTRFANNTIHQNVAEHCLTVSIRAALDGRTARVSTNRLDQDSLAAALEDAAFLAASQPRDPHPLPMPGRQRYRGLRRFVPATATLSADERARAVKQTCNLAEREGQVAAGIFSCGQRHTVLGNSRGLLASYRQTHSAFSVTMQHGPAASWAKANSADVGRLNPLGLAKTASEKAARAQNPLELAPGKFTVILEPAAVLDLVGFLFYDFAATAVADKRSCLSGRVGKRLFGENITIIDDAYHPEQLGAPFDGEGVPRQTVVLVHRGVVEQLVYSRGSAKRAHRKPTGHGFALPNEYGEAPMNLVVEGGTTSVERMIASTERGLLVTRLWYIREVDPYEKIMTGMTRDGLFLVDKGKIARAARNFRFNQSILEMLRNVECLGPAHRSSGEEMFEMVVPPMKVRDFHFTEVTKF